MAYSDTTLARKNYIKLSLNDREAALIHAMCEYTGGQPATFLRELLLKQAIEVLHGETNSGASSSQLPRPNQSLLAA